MPLSGLPVLLQGDKECEGCAGPGGGHPMGARSPTLSDGATSSFSIQAFIAWPLEI